MRRLNPLDGLSRLPSSRKALLRKYATIFVRHWPLNTSLSLLSLTYGTGKKGEGYIAHYQRHFKAIRNKELRILEIGIGGYKDPASGGHSLRMWKTYFPKSMIYGIDIFDKTFIEEPRIKTFRGSQNDPDFLCHVADEIGGIDIVIDDGSHVNNHVIQSFKTLFPKLRDNGIYVIEDLYTSFWPHFGGSFESLHYPKTSISMLTSLVHGLNYQLIPNRTPSYFDENIVAVHFYHGISFVFKGRNERNLPAFLINELEAAKKKH